MPRRAAFVLLLTAIAATGRADVVLEIAANATVSDRVALRLEVTNGGDAPAADVQPEVTYQGREALGTPLAVLPGGERHAWTFDLPSPADPGSVPAVLHVAYTGPQGRRASVPSVVVVSTPGLLPVPEVRATLTTSAVASFGRARLVLDNPTPATIHGRVVVVLPAGLATEPESQAARVAAGGQSQIPLVLQNRGAPAGAVLPFLVFFDYHQGGRRHLAVARAAATVAGAGPALPPLAVGATALGVAVALLILAWRRTARQA